MQSLSLQEIARPECKFADLDLLGQWYGCTEADLVANPDLLAAVLAATLRADTWHIARFSKVSIG
jgi:hypothetical protein